MHCLHFLILIAIGVRAAEMVDILTFTGRSNGRATTGASLSREFGLQAAIALYNRQSVQYQLRMMRVVLPTNYTGTNDTETAAIAASVRNVSFVAVVATNPLGKALAAKVATERGVLPIDSSSDRFCLQPYCFDSPRALLLLDSVAVATLAARRVLQRHFRRVAILTPTNCSVALAMREQLCRIAVTVSQYIEFDRNTEIGGSCVGACHAGDIVDLDDADVVVLCGRAEDVLSLIIRLQARQPNVVIFVAYVDDGDAAVLRSYVSAISSSSVDVTYWRGVPSVRLRSLVRSRRLCAHRYCSRYSTCSHIFIVATNVLYPNWDDILTGFFPDFEPELGADSRLARYHQSDADRRA
jgi:hypothetical protein